MRNETTEYTIEREYHRRVINSINALPDQCKSRPDTRLLVWSHEMIVPGAGKNGGPGRPDIGIVDEVGHIWIIEAKLAGNTELGRIAWQQLHRYVTGISQMTLPQVCAYSEDFLKERDRSAIPNTPAGLFQATDGLVDVIRMWQRHIGRALLPAEDVVSAMADSLQRGTYGIMVLSDVAASAVVNNYDVVANHQGPIAFVKGFTSKTNRGLLEYELLWHRESLNRVLPPHVYTASDSCFAKYPAQLKESCDPNTFHEALLPPAQTLWHEVLKPSLLEMGWDGKRCDRTYGAFGVALPIKDRRVPVLSVGFPGKDGNDTSLPPEYRGYNRWALRVYWQINWMHKKRCGDLATYNASAKRFYMAGWRGRKGDRADWGLRDIREDELPNALMQYRLVSGRKCLVGDDTDRRNLVSFVETLRHLIDALRGQADIRTTNKGSSLPVVPDGPPDAEP